MVSILLRGITGYAVVSTGPQLCVVVTQAHEALGETLPCGGGGGNLTPRGSRVLPKDTGEWA